MTIRVLLILVFAHGPTLVGLHRCKGYFEISIAQQIFQTTEKFLIPIAIVWMPYNPSLYLSQLEFLPDAQAHERSIASLFLNFPVWVHFQIQINKDSIHIVPCLILDSLLRPPLHRRCTAYISCSWVFHRTNLTPGPANSQVLWWVLGMCIWGAGRAKFECSIWRCCGAGRICKAVSIWSWQNFMLCWGDLGARRTQWRVSIVRGSVLRVRSMWWPCQIFRLIWDTSDWVSRW